MTTETGGRTFTGRHMLLVLLAFFGTIITVNMIMAYYANSTWSGLVVKNSYVASQNFNEQQAEARAHAALGWFPKVSYEAGEVRFQLKDAAGNAVKTEGVKVKLLRPANEGQDQILELVDRGEGLHAVSAQLADGQWVVEVLAQAGLDTPYRHATRIVIKDGVN